MLQNMISYSVSDRKKYDIISLSQSLTSEIQLIWFNDPCYHDVTQIEERRVYNT